MSTYDLFVVGAGSGGVRAARIAGALGARVAICEDKRLGGTCVNVGCVPKKLFVYASHGAEDFDDARAYGWNGQAPTFDWPTLIANKDREIARLNRIYQGLMDQAGVDVISGRGTIKEPQTVTVDGRDYRAKHILIATGSKARRLGFAGAEHVLTSDDMFALDTLPARMVILGGGYIAVEFAGILRGLGVEVSVVYRGPHLLKGFDDDIRRFLEWEMKKRGIDLRAKEVVSKVEAVGDGLAVNLRDGTELMTDRVLCACGRVPNSDGLGLEEAGVELDELNHIIVDKHYRTSVPSIFALGDVTGGPQLTPVALAEGMALARYLFAGQTPEVGLDLIPTAVFSQPPVGTVGLTEAAARARFSNVVIYRSVFTPMKHTLSGRPEKTMMKLVVDGDSDRVLGLHLVGPDAGEITQGFAVALRAGATKAQFDQTIGIHPTAAEEFVTMREPVEGPWEAPET